MNFQLIKQYLPRSLMGRSVLILLLPIIVLQVVVAGIFIQRHFEGVTKQLVRSVALEMRAIADRTELVGQIDDVAATMADTLEMQLAMTDGAIPSENLRYIWDISGITIFTHVQAYVQRPVSIDLKTSSRWVNVYVQIPGKVLTFTLHRDRLSASNPHQLIVLMIAASLILTLISLLFLRNQVRPIRRLARAAEAFGKGQSDPFRPAGADEVRRAGTAFLAMRGRIERQIEQRTQFLSGVSHDLRTPLTRMKLALATAEDLSDLDDLSRDVVEMERMIEEFLAFSRDDNAEDVKRVDVVELAEQIVRDCQRMGLDITLTKDGTGSPEFDMREMAVTRAIQNLTNNAGRYGTRLTLSVRTGERSVSFVVEDDGPGIAPELRSAALRPFSRLDASRNQNLGGGFGLGLAIALDVARSHGGSLVLDKSQDLGGLRASLTLPR